MNKEKQDNSKVTEVSQLFDQKYPQKRGGEGKYFQEDKTEPQPYCSHSQLKDDSPDNAQIGLFDGQKMDKTVREVIPLLVMEASTEAIILTIKEIVRKADQLHEFWPEFEKVWINVQLEEEDKRTISARLTMICSDLYEQLAV